MRGVRRSIAATAVLCVAALGAIGCAGDAGSRAEEFGALLAAQEYEEVQARVALAREDGQTGPWLDFAEGICLVEQGSDALAFRLLESAAAQDPLLGIAAAETLSRRARSAFEAGWSDQPRSRMAEALALDPSLDLGPYKAPVADYLYRFLKDYDRAYPLYRDLADSVRAMAARNEGARTDREWLYRYAFCLEQQGSLEAAMMVYQEYQHMFPSDMQVMRYVMWRYMNGLITEAEAARDQHELDVAMHKLEQTQETTWHMDLQQKARYLAGQIEQSRGRLEEARRWYQLVLDDGSQFGGELVGEAKTRMDEIRNQGVH